MDLEQISSLEQDLEPVYRFRTNYRPGHAPVERNTSKSMTVPGQDMSIAEIKARFQSGRPVDRNSGMMYTGEVYVPNVSRMDLTEQKEHMEMLKNNINNIREKISEYEAEQQRLKNEENEQYEAFKKQFLESQQKKALDNEPS